MAAVVSHTASDIMRHGTAINQDLSPKSLEKNRSPKNIANVQRTAGNVLVVSVREQTGRTAR